jgi:two-component system, NarL family, response regulator FusR
MMTENSGLNRKTQVLVVDDHPIVREGVRHRIETQRDMVVCCEVGRASDAMTFLHRNPVDIAIVDISLEGRSGIDLIKQIRASKFDFPVLVLTIHEEVTYAQRVLAAGAQGYLVKSDPPGLIIDALRRLLSGEFFISRTMASKIFARIGDPGGIDSGIASLSDRELEVLESIGRGHGTRQIADSLSLSISTIETYKHRLKIKLGLDSAPELAAYAATWAHSKKKQPF